MNFQNFYFYFIGTLLIHIWPGLLRATAQLISVQPLYDGLRCDERFPDLLIYIYYKSSKFDCKFFYKKKDNWYGQERREIHSRPRKKKQQP